MLKETQILHIPSNLPLLQPLKCSGSARLKKVETSENNYCVMFSVLDSNNFVFVFYNDRICKFIAVKSLSMYILWIIVTRQILVGHVACKT